MARARSATAIPILPEPDDPERPAAELDALERAPRPLAAAHGGIGRGDAPGEREQERERVLRGGDRVARRRVDDGDPGPRRRVQVDVVDADARPADDLEPRPGGDQRRVDRDLAPDDQRVVVADGRAQLLVGQARADVDLVAGPERLDALRRDGLRDEDPHRRRAAGRRRWAGRGERQAVVSRRATRAGARPPPPLAPRPRPPRRRSTSRPHSSDTASSVASASRISSSVTEPRCPTRKTLPVELALAAREDDAAGA